MVTRWPAGITDLTATGSVIRDPAAQPMSAAKTACEHVGESPSQATAPNWDVGMIDGEANRSRSGLSHRLTS